MEVVAAVSDLEERCTEVSTRMGITLGRFNLRTKVPIRTEGRRNGFGSSRVGILNAGLRNCPSNRHQSLLLHPRNNDNNYNRIRK